MDLDEASEALRRADNVKRMSKLEGFLGDAAQDAQAAAENAAGGRLNPPIELPPELLLAAREASISTDAESAP